MGLKFAVIFPTLTIKDFMGLVSLFNELFQPFCAVFVFVLSLSMKFRFTFFYFNGFEKNQIAELNRIIENLVNNGVIQMQGENQSKYNI